MKYTYAYKTSDGLRHEASMNAESREQVFSALRKQGIRPIKVVAADGSKANGEVRGVRKRVVAASVVLTALFVGVSVYVALLQSSQHSPGSVCIAKPLPRQEIAGHRDRIESTISNFENKAEAFLARFVEPGRPFTAPEADWPNKAEFEKVLNKPTTFAANEFTEQIDVKRMLAYLKYEMSFYLKHGGYVSGYIRELIRRQEMEIAERNKHSKKLNELLDKSDKDAYNYWLKANARLRAMGIYPLQLPDQLLHYSINSALE